MSRKKVQGPVRDKEKTKARMLSAVGEIIRTQGFHCLQITKIAKTAKVDKKLIYDYFGDVNTLIDEYLRTKDYWSKLPTPQSGKELMDGGRSFAKALLFGQFESLMESQEFQKIILWEISESKPALRKLADEREAIGKEMFVKIADECFGDNSAKFRALMAILISSTYYLNLHASVNGSDFCGLSFKKEEELALIREMLLEIVDLFYKEYQIK